MGFNQAQQEAVSHNEGPCLVLAGPGSGKTLTIVARIQTLIQTYQVKPEEILVITFTKYAAVEMKTRFFSEMSISVWTGEYPVRGGKTTDVASNCQSQRD